MRVIIQRCKNASVTINNNIVGSCDHGYTLLVGFTHGDNEIVIDKIINKIINLRIFEDENGKLNKNINDVNGSILSISQFTLYANCKEGRRPSFTDAMNYDEASKLYDIFNNKLSNFVHVETGVFGEDMKVSLINDGPTTIILDSDLL